LYGILINAMSATCSINNIFLKLMILIRTYR
jgi:hypothetical protein